MAEPSSSRAWQPVSLPADVPPPVGAYSPAVRAGPMLFVSGQVPRDPRTGVTETGDLEAQVRRVFDNLREILAAAGASLQDVVAVTVYLADVADWPAFNGMYKQVFSPPYPTRTVVGAALRDVKVEVTATAWLGGR